MSMLFFREDLDVAWIKWLEGDAAAACVVLYEAASRIGSNEWWPVAQEVAQAIALRRRGELSAGTWIGRDWSPSFLDAVATSLRKSIPAELPASDCCPDDLLLAIVLLVVVRDGSAARACMNRFDASASARDLPAVAHVWADWFDDRERARATLLTAETRSASAADFRAVGRCWQELFHDEEAQRRCETAAASLTAEGEEFLRSTPSSPPR